MTFFDTERLVYVIDGSKLVYYVLRSHVAANGPLTTIHKVKAKFVPAAIAIFMNHPDGVQCVQLVDMKGVEREKWNPIKLFCKTPCFAHVYKQAI